MLKSTHIPSKSAAWQSANLLPLGWSEHTAPTGHKYYYNAETKQSTYTHPAPLLHSCTQASSDVAPSYSAEATPLQRFAALPASSGQRSVTDRSRPEPRNRYDKRIDDRPKRKQVIPSCVPWVLVTTRLGRRFVHNLETGESLWRFPEEVMRGVVELDIHTRGNTKSPSPQIQAVPTDGNRQNIIVDPQSALSTSSSGGAKGQGGTGHELKRLLETTDDDEYEETEVTDNDSNVEEPSGWQSQSLGPGEVLVAELGEDDMEFQLAQMQEKYDHFGNVPEEDETVNHDYAWTDEDARESFQSLLDDYNIDPFTTWDSVLDAGHIIEDERYTFISTMKARRDAFSDWSAAKIQHLKEEKSHQAKQNPRIPYLTFLQQHATPKLFWTEFRRKFKTEPEIRSSSMTDKEREKLYREHINRVTKFPEAKLEADLQALLREIVPSAKWNRGVATHETLPAQLLADIRYISLAPSQRDRIVRNFVETLPEADETMSLEERDALRRQRKEREKQVAALKDRQAQVEEAKQRQVRDVRSERMRMQQGDNELKMALDIGRGGLLAEILEADKDP